MEHMPIKKWGNSNGLRLPKAIMEFLGVKTDDEIAYHTEEVDGKKRLVIESFERSEEITIEELFKGYESEKFKVTLNDLGEAVGNEKW